MRFLLAISAAVALIGAYASHAPASTVQAADYDAYWVWNGHGRSADAARAATLYLLQAEIAPGASGPKLVARAEGRPRPHAKPVWLVFRTTTIDWNEATFADIRSRVALWRESGPLVGVQIDFDARTRGLSGYADFLRRLKAELPPDCKLGVTGLMDWASQGDPQDLAALAGVVDEFVFQTYQGRATVAGIEDHVARLWRVKIPFKLGLVEGGAWRAPLSLRLNPNFKGYVVFLVGRKSADARS